MALKIPTSWKLAQLKTIAFKCGISTSGTKGVLTQRLHHEIQPAHHAKDMHTRILSIDMGIRNLAYCVVDVPHTLLSPPTISTRKISLPMIDSWHRIAVSSPPSTPIGSEGTLKAAKESFSPATLSASAYKLIRHTLLLQNPTHILIERQRFRSMGSKHILEWTVRVNMFESIIYAILCTMKEEGIWNGRVVSILPGKVGPYWVGEQEEVKAGIVDGDIKAQKKNRSSKTAKIINKGLKIDLVRRWLEAGDVVGLGNEAVEDRARRYMQKWDRLPGGRKGAKKGEKLEEEMGKLDDLADCLLQGMAWIQWEKNKNIALERVEALLDEADLDNLKAKKKAK
ncbi:ydc2 [Hyphodiscus hymeniophilus]|uniref:Ydc2 n=1 Tax=Hyphodiscus hymeniophilus TaxID=353542 RepID=A0A9P7B0K3_9HELO|nr:ydc2 [Hyphodiscus hymeniophilus]